MSSALFSSPLLRWIPIQSLVKIKKSLDKLGETPYDENGDIKGQETDSLVSAFKIGYFASASLVVIAIAVLSIMTTIAIVPFVDFSSFWLIFMVCLVALQRFKLGKLGSFRTHLNKLRMMVNKVSLENDKLTNNVDGLQVENQKLSTVTTEFEALAESMGSNVDRLTEIISETQEVHSKMKRQMEVQVQQQVLDVVLRADRNDDFTIYGKREYRAFCNRMKGIPSVEFDEENFRRIAKVDINNPKINLGDIFELLHNIKDPNVPEDQNVFHLEPRKKMEFEYKKKRVSGVYKKRRVSRSRAFMMEKQGMQTATLKVVDIV